MIIKRGIPPEGGDDKHWSSGMVFVCPCCETEFIPPILQYYTGATCVTAYCPVCKTQHCYHQERMYPYEPGTVIDVLKKMLRVP